MSRSAIAGAALLLVLASGCVTSHEEAMHSEPASDRKLEEAPEPATEAVAPADAEAPRSLEELQLELAANNAKLRELGVELPVHSQDTAPEGEAAGTTATPGKSKESTADDRNARPTVAPAPAEKQATSKSPRRDKAGGARPKPKDEAFDLEEGDEVRPDEAKAAPPSIANQLDPQQRCQQVCDLAEISCGLYYQICELADRHPDELDYASACERANADCEAANEACDACVE
ncbi:MAG TPA: hypothetical protein VM869_06620 [Enhygromyxa sp.]|nr:hypothetical protein [Enhygromyxa sp.]